ADRKPQVVRAMPNTPMLVGAGVVALSPGQWATSANIHTARDIFQSAGVVIEATEAQMDAVTAVSGSGPAYLFYLVEQMIQAGEQLGLSPAQARQLAAQTALGAAKMLSHSPDDPADLRRKVTSPGGTTEAAIGHLQQAEWPKITVQAI